MGHGASKNNKNRQISNMVTATSAFEDAGNRAKAKRQQQNGRDVIKEEEAVNGREMPYQANGDAVNTTKQETGETEAGQDDGDELMLSSASVKIQSVFRGYKERQQQKVETEMAIKIQRIYRRHSSLKKALSQSEDLTSPLPEAPITPQPLETCAEENVEVVEVQPDPCNNVPLTQTKHEIAPQKIITKKHLVGVGKQTKEDFIAFQDEITELKWYAEQQLERALCGTEFVGPRVVLVSSKVPKGELLHKLVRENVLIFNYDFNKDTFDVLLENIRVNLQSFKEGCKARSICLYCQGGPGFLYLRRSKVVTVAKLKKECEQDQVRFFKELGKFITKINPRDSVIHIMGCNVMGNAKGQELFDYLHKLMKPNQARFEAPLELSPSGVDMIETYFDFEKYKVWRSHKHSKVDADL